jgi:ubiquinone/menaquinone biosynthesis C-methylase UbiE
MYPIKGIIKSCVPAQVKAIAIRLRKMLVYHNYDSSEYWRKRASEPGQAAVLWRNQEYNQLYREDQRRIIAEVLSELPAEARVLDIGCGIGVVAKMMVEIRADIWIDAVDFEEMIAIARTNNSDPRISYISSPAEDYWTEEECYDLIVSSACYSAIRNIGTLESALDKAPRMLKHQGIVLMIDPFHRWNYLARTKYNSNDVIRRMRRHGLSLIKKSGILFWPYREWLANSNLSGNELREKYQAGERLLSLLGQHFWADYKVLVFKKK